METTIIKPNDKRQPEVDYIKTLAIFFMVIIHFVEDLSVFETAETAPTGFLQNFIEFCAGPLAAPVFIFAMGMGIVYSKHNEPKYLAKRAVSVLILALALNFFRDVLPYLIFTQFTEGIDPEYYRYLMFNIDILHFAALGLLFTALLKKLRVPVWAYIPIAVLLQIAGLRLSQSPVEDPVLECVLSYFIYTGELSCFPFLLWYLNLAAGIAAGEVIIRLRDTDRFYRVCFRMSLTMLAGFLFALNYFGVDLTVFYSLYEDVFYFQTFLHFIFNVLVIMLELSIFHFIHERTRAGYGFVKFCSSNLNTIYLIQWLIIGWFSAAWDCFGLEFASFELSVVLGILLSFICIGIAKVLPPINLTKINQGR